MRTNAIGDMIQEIWDAIPNAFPTVSLDASLVMPNHLHGIVFIELAPAGTTGPHWATS